MEPYGKAPRARRRPAQEGGRDLLHDCGIVEQQIRAGGHPSSGTAEQPDRQSRGRKQPEEPRPIKTRICSPPQRMKEHPRADTCRHAGDQPDDSTDREEAQRLAPLPCPRSSAHDSSTLPRARSLSSGRRLVHRVFSPHRPAARSPPRRGPRQRRPTRRFPRSVNPDVRRAQSTCR